MNVLEAMKRVNDLQYKIQCVSNIIMKLSTDEEFSQEQAVLNGYKNELHEEKEKLQKRLEKTQLVAESNLRGVTSSYLQSKNLL